MSKHQEWKMIHLLYGHARQTNNGDHDVLTKKELIKAGVHCERDTIRELEKTGIVNRIDDTYELSDVASKILNKFIVANGEKGSLDIRVDYPEVFIVMPFSEPWSNDVYTKFFKPGITDARFVESRGDSIVRVGDLSTNVWTRITQAGVIVAEVSVPNPNVYYEIGLADALGKPVFLFKQRNVTLPADFGGEHYYPYDLSDLAAARLELASALKDWAKEDDHQPFGVKEIVDRKRNQSLQPTAGP